MYLLSLFCDSKYNKTYDCVLNIKISIWADLGELFHHITNVAVKENW